MQTTIDALTDLHARLGAALAAGDVQAVQELAIRRQPLLEALLEAWNGADDDVRRRHRGALQALRQEESVLLARCRGLREDLQAELARRPHTKNPAGGRETSSLLDCTA